MFVPLCHIKYIREGVEKYIKIFESQTNSDYRKKELQELQYDIISEFDGEEAASEFINNHLENDRFREVAVENAIDKKDYDKALDLCSEAEKQSGNYRGQTDKWKKLRYRIYEETGNTNDQKELAYEFTLDGVFEYYLKLRKLYAGNSEDTGEWHQVFDDILSSVIKPYPKSIYTEILIHENIKPELLEYCKNSSYTIVNYYQHLLPDYKDRSERNFQGIFNANSIASKRPGQIQRGLRFNTKICESVRE